jgi:transcription initiation factor TFIID subunit 2
MDRLIPSPHNVVTIATLEVSLIFLSGTLSFDVGQFRLVLGVAGLIPNDPRVYFPLTR